VRDGAPSALYEGVLQWSAKVSSWRGSELLADDVPLTAGKYSDDESQSVPDQVELTVPRWDRGFDWKPGTNPEHPLAAHGQELVVSIVVTSVVTGDEYLTRMGRFQIQDWSEDTPGEIKLSTLGTFKVIADDQIPSPLAPRPTGTFISEIRRLLPAGMGVEVSDAIVDRTVPQTLEFTDDRLKAVRDLVDGIPARIFADGYGQLQVEPPLEPVPVPILTYRDGERGTVVTVPSQGSRDGIFNRVIVRATDTDGIGQNPVLAIVDKTTGPFTVDPEGYRVKSRIWSSPFVVNTTQALAAGEKILDQSLRPARVVRVEMAPDPRAQIGDPVEVFFDGGREVGYVIATQHPLTTNDGSSFLDVGIL
jgi:hypothetical protein